MTPREYSLARAYRFGTEEIGWETVAPMFPKNILADAREMYYLGYNDFISEMESCMDSGRWSDEHDNRTAMNEGMC